jgi:hypothetical protein
MRRNLMLLCFSISFFIIVFLFIGCQPTIPPDMATSFTSYQFEASNNTELSSDVTGIIDIVKHTISLTVPYDTDITSLVATFTLPDNATAKIGTTSQESGVTANDFTKPVIYTITAKGEEYLTQDWIVTVIFAQPIRYVAINGHDDHDGSEEAPWLTIQHALDTIPESGTIKVKPGVYYESIIFPFDKAIVLESVEGKDKTTVLGMNGSATVTTDSCPEGTALEGLTISHLSSGEGLGIYNNGPLTVSSCIISNNNFQIYGGGIYHHNGSLTINSCMITNNSTDYYGGGICNKYGDVFLDACIISANTASQAGGIYNEGNMIITSSEISDNYAYSDGGGIRNNGTITISFSTISHNSSTLGGGIENYNTLDMTSSIISENYAYSKAAGIYLASETNVTIGGENSTDVANFNTFESNYKIGSSPTAEDHIVNLSGDCHMDYPYNYFDPS